jgi:hypothetical protein
MAATVEELIANGWDASTAADFKIWMGKLDALVAAKCGGLTTSDFPDWHFADAFEEGTTPEDAFTEWCDDTIGTAYDD